jgi:CubicO group peptidase (beta-lactamase class C family)
MIMKTMLSIVLWALLPISFSFGQSTAGAKPAPTELSPGKPVEQQLSKSDKHAYRVGLKAGQSLFAVVDQKGIDVIVTVFGPDGKRLEEIDSPNGDQGPEPVSIRAGASGNYVIEVRPLEPDSKPGRYEIRIEKVLAEALSVTESVDRLFISWDKPDSPGCSLAVIKDGKVIYQRGYGSANLEYNIPITPSTVFHVASVSKQFTAFAIAMLANQGKLSLDDDIRKHLPEIHDFGKTITIRYLIHHTSGLRDQWELLAMGGWRLDDVITKDHILKVVRNQRELNFDPGQEHLYCNTGYTLLAVIVERVTGKSFREYTQDNIFKPLGMANTHFHDDHEMIVKNRAYSYRSAPGGGYKLSALNYANVGATSLFTTAEDMAKWVQNFDDGRVGGKAVIDQMVEQGVLNNKQKLDYAFGLVVGKYKGLKVVEHSGGDAGYRSHVMRFPDQKFAVVVLSNLASFIPTIQARQVADLYLGDQLVAEAPKAEAPKPAAPAVTVNPAIYDAYVGRYELQGGMIVTITKESGLLMAQPAGQPKTELVPESETRFLVKTINAEVTFQRDDKGKVNQFTLQQGSQTRSAKRIEPFTPDTAALAEYAGEYYSEELGTVYSLIVKDGKLMAQHRRHNDITMTPKVIDQFAGNMWFFVSVYFTRDNNKQITGFNLTGGRVRNLRFVKQSR